MMTLQTVRMQRRTNFGLKPLVLVGMVHREKSNRNGKRPNPCSKNQGDAENPSGTSPSHFHIPLAKSLGGAKHPAQHQGRDDQSSDEQTRHRPSVY